MQNIRAAAAQLSTSAAGAAVAPLGAPLQISGDPALTRGTLAPEASHNALLPTMIYVALAQLMRFVPGDS